MLGDSAESLATSPMLRQQQWYKLMYPGHNLGSSELMTFDDFFAVSKCLLPDTRLKFSKDAELAKHQHMLLADYVDVSKQSQESKDSKSPSSPESEHDYVSQLDIHTSTLIGSRLEQQDMSVDIFCNGWHVFGVCDGHGNKDVPRNLVKRWFPSLVDLFAVREWPIDCAHVRQAFLDIDTFLLKDKPRGGSTACIGIAIQDQLFVANTGDSRMVMINHDNKVVFQTQDHRPCVPAERKRIEAGGGSVDCSYAFPDKTNRSRKLGTSRAFGDAAYKLTYAEDGRLLPPITAAPDVDMFSLDKLRQKRVRFLLFATDGVWDTLHGIANRNDAVQRLLSTTSKPAITSENKSSFPLFKSILDLDDKTAMLPEPDDPDPVTRHYKKTTQLNEQVKALLSKKLTEWQSGNKPVSSLASKLVAFCETHDGDDNKTVVLVDLGKPKQTN